MWEGVWHQRLRGVVGQDLASEATVGICTEAGVMRGGGRDVYQAVRCEKSRAS